MRQAKPNTIAALGLNAYLDANFMYRPNGEKIGGSKRFRAMATAKGATGERVFTDQEIADWFFRFMPAEPGGNRQAVAYWRRLLEAE